MIIRVIFFLNQNLALENFQVRRLLSKSTGSGKEVIDRPKRKGMSKGEREKAVQRRERERTVGWQAFCQHIGQERPQLLLRSGWIQHATI